MTQKITDKRDASGGRLSIRATAWTCALSLVAMLNGPAQAGQSSNDAMRFLRPAPVELPVWKQVDPDKAEIFKKPTLADPGAEVRCLALNIYFEARSEPEMGKLAVGHVVMNRVNSGKFPATVCDVVQQGGEDELHRCQFSWWCDGRSDRPLNRREWQKSSELALSVYWGRTQDPTQGALWYHADYVEPWWRTAFARGPKIGRHIFYSRSMTKTQLASRLFNR